MHRERVVSLVRARTSTACSANAKHEMHNSVSSRRVSRHLGTWSHMSSSSSKGRGGPDEQLEIR